MKRRSFLKTLIAAATIAVGSKFGVYEHEPEPVQVMSFTTYVDSSYRFWCDSRSRQGIAYAS